MLKAPCSLKQILYSRYYSAIIHGMSTYLAYSEYIRGVYENLESTSNQTDSVLLPRVGLRENHGWCLGNRLLPAGHGRNFIHEYLTRPLHRLNPGGLVEYADYPALYKLSPGASEWPNGRSLRPARLVVDRRVAGRKAGTTITLVVDRRVVVDGRPGRPSRWS